MTTCPHCGAEPSPEDIYCPRCHRNLTPYRDHAAAETAQSTPMVRRGELFGILVILLLFAGGAAFVYSRKDAPAAMTPKSAASTTACMSNMKQLAVAAMIYQTDYSDVIVHTPSFQSALLPYIKNNKVFECPTTTERYAINTKLLKLSATAIKNPASTVFFFDAKKALIDYPHTNLAVVAFTDTHVKAMPKTAKLNYTP